MGSCAHSLGYPELEGSVLLEAPRAGASRIVPSGFAMATEGRTKLGLAGALEVAIMLAGSFCQFPLLVLRTEHRQDEPVVCMR
jgi:hypothetical protein